MGNKLNISWEGPPSRCCLSSCWLLLWLLFFFSSLPHSPSNPSLHLSSIASSFSLPLHLPFHHLLSTTTLLTAAPIVPGMCTISSSASPLIHCLPSAVAPMACRRSVAHDRNDRHSLGRGNWHTHVPLIPSSLPLPQPAFRIVLLANSTLPPPYFFPIDFPSCSHSFKLPDTSLTFLPVSSEQ